MADAPPLRLAIVTPFGGPCEPEYVRSIWDLKQWLATHKVAGYGEQYHTYLQEAGSCVDSNRHRLIAKAAENGATHVLMADSDMNFTEQAVRRMMERHLPLVACNYLKRSFPISFVAKDADGNEIDHQNFTGTTVADTCGLGLVFAAMEVFEKMPLPWFKHEWDGEKFIGEDQWFFKRAAEAGYPCVIDNEASSQVTHIGRYQYSALMVQK